jgi:transcriptional regulator with XRE-family HTH domain
MNQEKIGKFISKSRKDKNLTQEELAEELNITKNAVSKWERGLNMPDVSLMKDLCDILDISLNELFAGEKIKNDNVKKYDENLDKILKEYYKMKKRKNIFIGVLTVILVLLATYLLRIGLVLGSALFFDGFVAKEDKMENNFDKNYYIEKYSGDLDSNLLVFPDKITKSMKDVKFSSSLKTGLFDTDGYIILEYSLDEENFKKEKERLSNLSITIENYDGKKYTNKIRYDETSYNLPAYITIDGFDSAYEYALLDDNKKRIYCIYLSYPNIVNKKYKKYLKKNKKKYLTNDSVKSYSIYNHTFDGGKSYVEFSDKE